MTEITWDNTTESASIGDFPAPFWSPRAFFAAIAALIGR